MSERSQITWGTTTIRYEIRRSARRATAALTIDPETGLVVTAPKGTSIEKLDAVVRAKARWVVERLKRRSDRPPAPTTKEFVSGETFRYLGRQCRLKLVPSGVGVSLRGGWLEVSTPKGLALDERRRHVGDAVRRWYVGHARERLPGWTRAWAAKAKLEVERVVVTEQAKRWGSCSGGVVRVNWRIIQAPRSLVDYVLAHEVTHLAHEEHGPAFWAALGRLLPDYEVRRAGLKEIGATLVW